ncbi:MAG: polysaccharide biosynthesis/export family protein [Fuerstiella sp.]
MNSKRQIVLILACVFCGCAQSPYRASSLPQRLAARPVRDYSQLDLTPHATQITRQDAIKPGDRLVVTLDPGTLELDSKHEWNVSVDAAGSTSLPNIGPVRLAGLTSTEAEKAIVETSLERDVFLTPVVEVKLAQRRERTVLVSGAVATPGPLKLTEDAVSLADVIVRAGGITNKAEGTITISASADPSGSAAEPVPPNAVLPVSQKSVKATSISLETTPDSEFGSIMVPEGSVVHVEELAPRPIKVVGVIRNQVVEVPAGQNVHLLDAVTMAGGQTYSNWISDRVTITRRVPGENRTVRIRGSIRKARSDSSENILLAPYDIVTVEENLVTFTLSTLSGLFGAGVSAAQMGAL